MITVIAVDDQLQMLESVKRAIKDLDFVKLITATTNPIDALHYFEHTQPHVALLDIDMPGLDGLSLAQSLHTVSPDTAVIFITSHDSYLRDAFKVYAYDFLDKPVDEQRLAKTLWRINQQRGDSENPISLTTEEGTVMLKPSDIVYVEASGRYCTVVLLQQQYLVHQSLKEMEALLKELPCFFKSARSFLVNMHFIKSVERLNRTSLEIHFKGTKSTAQLSKQLYDAFNALWQRTLL